jgi:hypothetical protein
LSRFGYDTEGGRRFSCGGKGGKTFLCGGKGGKAFSCGGKGGRKLAFPYFLSQPKPTSTLLKLENVYHFGGKEDRFGPTKATQPGDFTLRPGITIENAIHLL